MLFEEPVNFVGPWHTLRAANAQSNEPPFLKHYDMGVIFELSNDRDALDILREELQGKVAVISDIRAGAEPLGHPPLDPEFPLSGIVAQAVNTMLTGEFIRPLPSIPALLLEALLLLGLGALGLRGTPLRIALGTVVLIVLYGLAGIALFLHAGRVLPFSEPLGAAFFVAMSLALLQYLQDAKAREVLRRSFEAYFPPAIVKRIMAQPDLITSAGHKKELTILFSDIQGFTALSESMPPDDVRRLLNEYFGVMVEIVFHHGGTVDKFIGDGLMVFFGDPEPQPDHAVRCVRCAAQMQRALDAMRVEWQSRGDIQLHARIGINTGVVVVGNMGSNRRLSYTVLGAAVNLAQRLESNAGPDGILISERTHELIRAAFHTRPLGPIPIKGLAHSIPAFEVLWRESSGPAHT